MTNGRYDTTGTTAKADFGNCNALIMRCASPKCSSGGCTDISVATPIVAGCVQSNASCKQYGDDLTQYIAAQLVAQSTAKANQQAADAAAAASSAASEMAAQQMQQMQMQMQQMQMDMQAQNAETVAQLQNALEEQKQLTANAIAEATAAKEEAATPATSNTPPVEGLTAAQAAAAQSGVDPNLVYRDTVTGEIMTAIENAEMQLKTLKVAMDAAFEYAGCDSTGSNCTGPHRVKRFKQYANEFFDPYENVLEEMLDALETAQILGVDINDIYMFLSNSCNQWALYMCQYSSINKDGSAQTTYKFYDNVNCVNGRSVANVSPNYVKGGAECTAGMAVPPEDDPACTMTQRLNSDEEVRREYLAAEMGERDAMVRVGCASSILNNVKLFSSVKKKRQSQVDVETLRNILAQDGSMPTSGTSRFRGTSSQPWTRCAIPDETSFQQLQTAINKRTLPDKICVNSDRIERNWTSSSAYNFASQIPTSSMYDTTSSESQRCIKCGGKGYTPYGNSCQGCTSVACLTCWYGTSAATHEYINNDNSDITTLSNKTACETMCGGTLVGGNCIGEKTQGCYILNKPKSTPTELQAPEFKFNFK